MEAKEKENETLDDVKPKKSNSEFLVDSIVKIYCATKWQKEIKFLHFFEKATVRAIILPKCKTAKQNENSKRN